MLSGRGRGVDAPRGCADSAVVGFYLGTRRVCSRGRPPSWREATAPPSINDPEVGANMAWPRMVKLFLGSGCREIPGCPRMEQHGPESPAELGHRSPAAAL